MQYPNAVFFLETNSILEIVNITIKIKNNLKNIFSIQKVAQGHLAYKVRIEILYSLHHYLLSLSSNEKKITIFFKSESL